MVFFRQFPQSHMASLSLLDSLIVNAVRRLWRFRRFKGRLFIVDHLLPVAKVMASRYGPAIRVHRYDFTNRAAIFGLYGDEIAHQIRTLRPNDVFIDVGANTGVFSLLASSTMGHGTVFAFEPNSRLFRDLCFNVDVNGSAGVIPFNIALSDRTGTFGLVHNAGHSGGAALRDLHDGPPGAETAGESIVLAVAPKEIGAMLQATENRRVCMKIDVEGHELNVLRGLRDAGLLARAAWVIVEIDPSFLGRFGASVDDIYDLMRSESLRPTKGLGFAEHYDEIFVNDSKN